MVDRIEITSWWQRELQRDFTKLECGLLGATFATVAIILLFALRAAVG
jgi:hypothetical protein